MSVTLMLGDCLERLRELPDASVDACVTDPPYGLSFMGKGWDHAVPSVEVWREVLRVLKPGAHLLAFFGTRTYHRGVVAIEDAGFEVRDQIGWAFGSGFPKSHDVSKAIDAAAGAVREVVGSVRTNVGMQGGNFTAGSKAADVPVTVAATPEAQRWQGWGTALKPAWEPIVVARKPLEGTVAANVLAWGTGAINVDGCRVEGAPPSVPQPAFNSPTGRIYGMKADEGRNGTMSQASGRWPANLIHDGSDEVTDLFAGTEKLARPGRRNKGHDDYSPGAQKNCYAGGYKGHSRSTAERHFDDTGSAARFFYCAKASRADREDGLDGAAPRVLHRVNSGGLENDPRWAPVKRANNHPTVKPTDLMRYLCRLVTPPGGTVLDPFMGSGSTGRGAMLEGFSFIGCELDPEYLEIARARIAAVTPEPPAPPKASSPAPVGQLRLF